MTRKSMTVFFVMALLAVGGVMAVMAQDNSDTPVPFGTGCMRHWGNEDFGTGMMHSPMMDMGMMGGGFGQGMMWDNEEPMMLVVAEALGLEPEAFYTALQSGQTLTEIAEAQGVALESVHAAMILHAEEHVAEMVAGGYITQEQADEHLTWIRDNIEQMPMFSENRFGACMGGQAGFGPGMMGYGHGRGHNNR